MEEEDKVTVEETMLLFKKIKSLYETVNKIRTELQLEDTVTPSAPVTESIENSVESESEITPPVTDSTEGIDTSVNHAQSESEQPMTVTDINDNTPVAESVDEIPLAEPPVGNQVTNTEPMPIT
jgi:hypothetical protein